MPKTNHPAVRPIAEVHHPEHPERQQLRGDELTAGERRDVQLLERAELLLARDVLRADERADQRDERHQHARHHVVLVVQRRVVPAAQRTSMRPPPRTGGCSSPDGRTFAMRRPERRAAARWNTSSGSGQRTTARCPPPIPSRR